jgi:hypothetical protein
LASKNRADYTVTKTSRICEKHFDERFITREDKIRSVSPKLTPDAFPSIFEGQPYYMTKQLPPKRKEPSERNEEI